MVRPRRGRSAARILRFVFGLCAFPLLLHADPLEELKGVTALESLDAHRLEKGEILTARGLQGNFARGLYLESLYYLEAPVPAVGDTLLHWNPARYKESEISQYQTYAFPGAVDFFRPFQLHPRRAADRFLLDASASAAHGPPGELHLSPAETALLRGAGAWPQILARRSEAMAAGGLAAVPDYLAGDVLLNACQEYHSLLKMAPAIAARFTPLIDDRALFPGTPAATIEVVPYVEESLVRGHTSWCLGVLGARPSTGAWQVYDCTYYAADTYFMAVSLYQLWPWEKGTLVWQVAYVSAPFRPWLAHVDKVFAGREMAKDSAKSVALLRRELEARSR